MDHVFPPPYARGMASHLRRPVLAVLLAAVAFVALPGLAHAAVGTLTATAPTASVSTCTNTTCNTKIAAAVTINASTAAQTIQVTLTLCKGTATTSCTAVVVAPVQTFSVPASTKSTSLAPAYTYTCKTSGTTSFFTKAVMTNGTAAGTVTAYSTPKSQKGCLT